MAEMKEPSRDALIELRFNQRMTREAMAEHFDVSIATVRRWIKELKVPRPPRRKLRRRAVQRSTESVQLCTDSGYTRLERAQMHLEGRLIEKPGYGYYLDGRPASVEAVLAAANV